MLCGIVHIAAYGTNVDTCRFLFREIDFGKDRLNGMVEIHHALCFEVLIALRRMRTAIDGRMITDKFAHTADGGERFLKVVKNDGLLVFIERLVHIGDVAVEHIEETAVLYYYEAVAFGVTLCLDIINTVADLLALGEVIVRAVGEGHGNDVVDAL